MQNITETNVPYQKNITSAYIA